ncbi:hypothetical protein WJX81_006480 [Elliptochloris bilobata]|uniref:C2 NT-type domain-containing protein n=1 Tax=Elliptochloris bilobata TaxID=381761 RepID=A0AAW1RCK0_9CHLO
MGLFGGTKKRELKYHFYVHIQSVAPWPAHFKSIFIAWSRGSSKKGVTKAVAAVPGESGRTLETAFHVPCTIFQDARGQAEKKWLVLALHEAAAPGPKGSAVPGRAGVPREPLGRVVVDLADFAAEDGRATRALAVAFSSAAVKAAVGSAKMLLTIGCLARRPGMREGDLAAFSASTSGTATPVDDGSANIEADVNWDEGNSYASISSLALSARGAAGEPALAHAHAQTGSESNSEEDFLAQALAGSAAAGAATNPFLQGPEEAPGAAPAAPQPAGNALPQRKDTGFPLLGAGSKPSEASDGRSAAVAARNPFVLSSMPEGEEDEDAEEAASFFPSAASVATPRRQKIGRRLQGGAMLGGARFAPGGQAQGRAQESIFGEEEEENEALAPYSSPFQPSRRGSEQRRPAASRPGASERAEDAEQAATLVTREVGVGESAAGAPLRTSESLRIPDSPPLRSAEFDRNRVEVDALHRELRMVAALEAAVYLARTDRGGGGRRRSRARSCHAPARRIARTTISLGYEEGVAFGLRAIRAMEAAARGASDVMEAAFWWSNCLQLRWMLWAMSHSAPELELHHDDAEHPADDFDWVMQVLVPPLRQLETRLFGALVGQLWRSAAADAAISEPAYGDIGGSKPSPPPSPSKGQTPKQSPRVRPPPSAEEAAVRRWLDGLQAANRALLGVAERVPSGHALLLHKRALVALLRRLDAALFDELLAGNAENGAGQPGSAFADANGSEDGAGAVRDARLLPFPRGALSFGVGIALKLAVTRWANWAVDAGLHNAKKGAEEGAALFPHLRAAADLLMMPKEALMDTAIRAEMLPGLGLGRVVRLLQRFLPDDFAQEPLPAGLLTTLESQAVEEAPIRVGPAAAAPPAYEPPTESALLADGLIEPVSLEMDGESEDEVEALSELMSPPADSSNSVASQPPLRFALLRDLWASAR